MVTEPGDGAYWKLTRKGTGHSFDATIQASGGKLDGWYLGFSDAQEQIEREQPSTSHTARNCRRSPARGRTCTFSLMGRENEPNMALLTFIFTIVGISLSGVMAPGPITAATLAAGERNRHAGVWICIGHIAVELPLILLLAAGLGTFLESKGIAAIGLVGGVLLLLMGVQLLASLRKPERGSVASVERHPFWIGVVLSGPTPTSSYGGRRLA